MSQPKQLRTANDDIAQPQSFELPMRNETLHVPDLESQPKDRDEPSGWFRLYRQQRRDNRHMVVPRFTEIHMHCLAGLGNTMSSLQAAIRRTDKAGQDISELSDKLYQSTMRYGQMLLQVHQIHALSQPNNRFLRNLLPINRAILNDDDTSFFDEPTDDWALIPNQDRMDQVLTPILATDIGSLLASPFKSNTEKIGDHTLEDYHEGLMKFVIFTVFSLILGIFTCAPAGIQSLNVVSTIGEVAVYVAFVIVFGWLALALFRGTEKSLMISLAFAALMATLLRGNN